MAVERFFFALPKGVHQHTFLPYISDQSVLTIQE